MAGDQLELDLDLPARRERRTRTRRSVPAGAPEAIAGPEVDRVSPVVTPSAVGTGPFNYTDALWEVVRDVVTTLEELRHVNLDHVLLSVAQARQASTHGVYASCVPLRFAGGARETVVRKRRYRMPELHRFGREVLYILYFMLPRFHEEQDYHEKLATIIHELYHISPEFDGDIRRFSGRNFAHGHSREVYHAAMRKLADRYLATSPRAGSHEFLKLSFSELMARPGGVVGFSLPRPKAVLVRAGSR